MELAAKKKEQELLDNMKTIEDKTNYSEMLRLEKEKIQLMMREKEESWACAACGPAVDAVDENAECGGETAMWPNRTERTDRNGSNAPHCPDS